jgi:hypothetical protein
MNCKFCNQPLTPTPGYSKCNLYCKYHNMFVYYFLKDNLIDLEFLALYENSPTLKCIQLNYATNTTCVFIDNASKPILTLNRILSNLTPDNFHHKFKTIITFS